MADGETAPQRGGWLRRLAYRWFPWKYVLRWLAQSHGLFDPFAMVARLDRLAQPSEVRAPFELVKAGIQFHARGTMNARVIQSNLDWQWPYWVQRQFDPSDNSFLPRGFSVSHVNLTHRNWTAVGLPDCRAYPLVDPRGLLTPFFDGWSIDVAVVPEEGEGLFPAAAQKVDQRLEMEDSALAVVTSTQRGGLALDCRVWVEEIDGRPVCCMRTTGRAERAGWLVVSLRPFNPEGVSFVNSIRLFDQPEPFWQVDGDQCVWFHQRPERHTTSTYAEGDVFLHLLERPDLRDVEDEAGLATAAAMFRINRRQPTEVLARVTLEDDAESRPLLPKGSAGSWNRALDGTARLNVPDERFQMIYDAALRSMVLMSPADVYPGPYTYRRFWFRDAVVILQAMLCAGLDGRSEEAIDRFSRRQRVDGFFQSQNGEWDSNGQVLWMYNRFCQLTGLEPKSSWRGPAIRGARWLCRKRVSSERDVPHAGLLPAGFSAEHLGNNDFYYWDDFWGVAGLRAAADLCDAWGKGDDAEEFRREADKFMACIERSLEQTLPRRRQRAVPASPYRRMDGGAVGSLAVSYPLALWPPLDHRLMGTVEFLRREYFLDGAFFHALAHSGINVYLTLHVAQVLLRAGDPSFFEAVQRVAQLASPTGQWPEAIHPRTGGGCMGDGQHVWASAEWVMMMRNMFVREEGGSLVLASGIPDRWLASGSAMSFGPAPTPHGPLTVTVQQEDQGVRVAWDADWRGTPPALEVRLPGRAALEIDSAKTRHVTVPARSAPGPVGRE